VSSSEASLAKFLFIFIFGWETYFFEPSKHPKNRQTRNKQEPKFQQDENRLPPSLQISNFYPAALVDEFNNWLMMC
jgi:hypothetical protein